MQGFVTVVIRFAAAHAGAVNARLAAINRSCRQRFESLPDADACVHFISMNVVVDAPTQAYLVLEASVDGGARQGLGCIVKVIGAELAQLLEQAKVQVQEPLDAYLEKHRFELQQGLSFGAGGTPGIAFSGVPEMTVPRIRREAALAQRLTELLESRRHSGSALQIVERIRREIFCDIDFKWACVPQRTPLLDAPPARGGLLLKLAAVRHFLWPVPILVAAVGWLVSGLAAFAALVAAVVGLGLLVLFIYGRLRRDERRDVPLDCEASLAALSKVAEHENCIAQNHLAGVSSIKARRGLLLRVVFWALRAKLEYEGRPGELSGISSVHFARWLVLPGTDKLLFFSNYDGSWMSYLEDFIMCANRGLTAIWSNTRDFPLTSHLTCGGASDGARFKRWARRQQQPTLFWYSAYPSLTMAHIRQHAAIRHGFATISSEADAAKWLKRFGIHAPVVEMGEIPTLAFGRLSRLRHAHCLLIELAEQSNEGLEWLRQVEADVSYGMHASGSAAVVGFTARGLSRLGLDPQALATFPAVFQQGMHAPVRARALGDMQGNAPGEWLWGGPSCEVDAILLVYDASEGSLDTRVSASKFLIERLGHQVVHELRLDPLPGKQDEPQREPFGFIDGTSQPVMRGVRAAEGVDPIHGIEPGELILGYRSNLGFTAPTPHHNGVDLGRNGSYLVVRQLEQDPAAFEQYLHAQEARLPAAFPRAHMSVDERVEWIAAKMIGRWRLDGSSLVNHPFQPASKSGAPAAADNDFMFGTDPDGLRCPLGAHVRRSNPRDSFEPGSDTALRIVNRHRMLRVGRIYKEPATQEAGLPAAVTDAGKPGLLFMCVNADIENQFEFLQQTWLLSRNFHGLKNEDDPVVGQLSMTIPTAHGPVRLRGMADFVKVLGGNYFFMPSRSTISLLCSRREAGPSDIEDGPGVEGEYTEQPEMS